MKRLSGLVWRGLSHLLYWSGIGPLTAAIWRRSARDTWTVLAYHRIGDPSPDGGPDHVTARRFRAHLRYLKRRYDVVTVGEALDSLRAGQVRERPLVSITFDDGYADNVANALPILMEEGCRATLYPTLEAIEEGHAPWTHCLARDLKRVVTRGAGQPSAAQVPAMIAPFLSSAGKLSDRDLSARLESLVDRVKAQEDGERRRICEAVSRLVGPESDTAPVMLDAAGLLAWRRAGMEVGSHTARHPILSRTRPSERRAELALSRRGLEQVLGIPVLHLAYPNGRADDWDQATMIDARASGYVSAMTTLCGVNRRDLDPYAIRRINAGNDAVAVLAMRISPLGILLRSAPGPAAARVPRSETPAGDSAARVRPLRIAFIGGRGIGSAYSGIERYYEELGSRLAARGHQVVAYCRPHFAPEASVYRGLEVRRLPTVRAKHLETIVHSLLSTFDVCFRRVDLVQFHALGSSPLSWIPRLAGKRTVVSVRGLDWQRGKWGRVARAYLRFCEWTSVYCPNATAVVSRTLQRHFEARFGRPVRYIPNGVAPTEPLPPVGVPRWGLEARGYFLYAGRLSPEKGLDILIEAHRGMHGPRLVLAGGSSYSEAYMERLRATAGEETVFTGFLTGRDLVEIYSNALAFVLPSKMEGLSVALLEALAYGLPVVASDIPENRELVDECGGFLFRLDDVEDLRRVLRSIAASPQEAHRVGESARRQVQALFDWERIAGVTEEFYGSVMTGSRARTAERVAPLASSDRDVASSDRGARP
jgi:glycosyltransferase involved in cell wall biosynthesis/peptidoglycan/xylan/chitin deacetylase (PgdA/CDA1 family)